MRGNYDVIDKYNIILIGRYKKIMKSYKKKSKEIELKMYKDNNESYWKMEEKRE